MMKTGKTNLTLEKAMRELHDAQLAQVFARTPVSGASATEVSAVSSSRRYQLWRIGLVGLSAAASLTLVFGLWGMTSTMVVSPVNSNSHQLAFNSDGSAFAGCISGPTGELPGDCQGLDADGDGDVDLADFSAFQLSLANSR